MDREIDSGQSMNILLVGEPAVELSQLAEGLSQLGHRVTHQYGAADPCAIEPMPQVVLLAPESVSLKTVSCLAGCSQMIDVPLLLLGQHGDETLLSGLRTWDVAPLSSDPAVLDCHIRMLVRIGALKRRVRELEKQLDGQCAPVESMAEVVAGGMSGRWCSYELLVELTVRREQAREEERRRIARDLHDEMGQVLTALRMDMSLLRLRHGHQDESLLQQIQQAMKRVDSIIQVVRNVARKLRPAVLDMGIAAALQWQAEHFSRQSGIVSEVEIATGDFALDNERATALYRIVQESLTNVARHSRADRVCISLGLSDDGYELNVSDNGIGFDPTDRSRKTFGLMGIRERVLLLEGELSIRSQLNQGTHLRLRIPATRSGSTA